MKRKRDGMFYCEAKCARCRATSTCAWLTGAWLCEWCSTLETTEHLETATLQNDLGPWRVIWEVRIGTKVVTRSI